MDLYAASHMLVGGATGWLTHQFGGESKRAIIEGAAVGLAIGVADYYSRLDFIILTVLGYSWYAIHEKLSERCSEASHAFERIIKYDNIEENRRLTLADAISREVLKSFGKQSCSIIKAERDFNKPHSSFTEAQLATVTRNRLKSQSHSSKIHKLDTNWDLLKEESREIIRKQFLDKVLQLINHSFDLGHSNIVLSLTKEGRTTPFLLSVLEGTNFIMTSDDILPEHVVEIKFKQSEDGFNCKVKQKFSGKTFTKSIFTV